VRAAVNQQFCLLNPLTDRDRRAAPKAAETLQHRRMAAIDSSGGTTHTHDGHSSGIAVGGEGEDEKLIALAMLARQVWGDDSKPLPTVLKLRSTSHQE
jgi:hypothetical protein